MRSRPIRNIGVFAHVDAGKTTLTEQMLTLTGTIREGGSVDKGTAHTDNLPVEQRRGISVKACCVQMTWKNTLINLIDTPGHIDFSAEVERSFWALDAAILVVCGVEGMQPHTETLFHALKAQQIPTLIFINKTDREGADPDLAAAGCRELLSSDAVPMWNSDALIEAVCVSDDVLLESYLMGDLPDDRTIADKAKELTACGLLHPIYRGSAIKGDGVRELMDAIVDLLPSPGANENSTLCGVVFAAAQDRLLGRGAWVRLYSGQLENRSAVTLPAGIDPLTGKEKLIQRKITQIRGVDARNSGLLKSGEIGIVYGLGEIGIGYILGDKSLLPRKVSPGSLKEPLMKVQVIPENPDDMNAIRAACQILSGEDPLLKVQYSKTLNQLHMHVMGTIQLEILQEMLENRFGFHVTFSKPSVIYKETIARPAEGYVAYLAPKPCWAIMRFLIEPGQRGSGITFCSKIHVRDLPMQYQNQIEQALPLALAQGRSGWQVDDVKITLIEGNSHQYHTHPLDFIVATPMGIQDGLQRGGSMLLEPILSVRFILPIDSVGRVISDVALMRGEVLETEAHSTDRVMLHALVPVESSMDYAITLASATGGRGAMSVSLHGYRECPEKVNAIAPRRSVDPLDTSKYILAARSALEGGIFDLG